MRILWSFNTKLDEHELYNAIKENGQWNAILIKKHRIFLIRPMIWMLFAFVTFWLLIWFAYSQFYNPGDKWIFRILTIAYSLVTFTRCVHSIVMIMSDIQDQINNRNGYIDKIDESEFKDGKYEIFLKHTFISAWLQVVLMLINSSASFFVLVRILALTHPLDHQFWLANSSLKASFSCFLLDWLVPCTLYFKLLFICQ